MYIEESYFIYIYIYISKRKLLYAKRAQSRPEKLQGKKNLITKMKRIKEQREGITRCESPSPRPSKQLSQVQCSF